MELTHEFTVPASLEETWEAFNDIEGVGACFPGAQVTGVEGDTFTGTVKVKLGPIALVYGGTGTFVDKDEAARTMTIQAKGKDKRGNGTAGADVVATMTDVGGATRVEVVTDLAITGKPAQFGRGVIQDVSDKLLGQFTACLASKVGTPEPGPDAGSGVGSDAGSDVGAVPAPEPISPPSAAASTHGPTPDPAAPAPAARPAAPGPASYAAPAGRDQGTPDALDLGATVLPVLVKAYGKQLAAGLLGLLVLGWVVRSLRR